MDFDFKVPSAIPQDLLLIQDLIGFLPTQTANEKQVPDSLDSSDDSIASSSDGVESEDEVEADLVPRDEDSRISIASSDSALHSDSESDSTSSSSDSEVEHDIEEPQQQKSVDDVEEEDLGMTTAATCPQTKNEIVDADIMVPTISEIEPCDTLEKVGDIMNIVGNIVIVRGRPVNHVKSLSEHALDAESLLVFDDRKVLGYIYETFGPTSQPFYQVRFSRDYPLDTSKIWLSREVFHVPQRSHFVFVDQLKKLHGSDASNIHDEEPADDEIEFSDDEKEAAFRAERKRRQVQRGHSASSSRQATPIPNRHLIDDMAQDTYHSSNPYDAHGPYDDDYQVTGPSRPPPAPYDDPYADDPTSGVWAQPVGMNDGPRGEPDYESGRARFQTTRGSFLNRGTRGSGVRNRRSLRRGHRHEPVASRRTFGSNTDFPFEATPQMVESVTGYGQRDAMTPHPFAHLPPNSWLPPGTNNIPEYQQPFIQPHINPRFASMFGIDLPPGSVVPWASQNAHDHESARQHWVGTWTMHSGTGSQGEGDTYRPM